MPSIGFASRSSRIRRAHAVVGRLLERRQELVQRRVEQADRDREAGHRLEDALEVALLHRQQPGERRAARLLGAREDHLAHDRQPVLGHEHVLGAAEADALGAELAGLGGVLGRVGVGAHAHAGAPRRPTRGWSRSSRRSRGGTSGAAPSMTVPVPPSIVIRSPSLRACPPIETVRATVSISRPSQPATHGLPMPRATTAACEVMPPWAVSTPWAWIRPWMSSGVVSQRTRTTLSPARPSVSAESASSTIAPAAGARRGVEAGRDHLHVGASGRSSGAAAGRAGPGRCARPPRPSRSGPRPPSPRRRAARPARCACRCASAACRAGRPRP